MTEQQENRIFSRINFDANAMIIGNDREWNTELLDISLKGALVEKPPTWEADIGSPFELTINLSPDTIIDMQVNVAHVENNHIGFSCDHIDLDSITHLRRIIELNTGNEDLLHRELEALQAK